MEQEKQTEEFSWKFIIVMMIIITILLIPNLKKTFQMLDVKQDSYIEIIKVVRSKIIYVHTLG